jgi:hypothetical protein
MHDSQAIEASMRTLIDPFNADLGLPKARLTYFLMLALSIIA